MKLEEWVLALSEAMSSIAKNNVQLKSVLKQNVENTKRDKRIWQQNINLLRMELDFVIQLRTEQVDRSNDP